MTGIINQTGSRSGVIGTITGASGDSIPTGIISPFGYDPTSSPPSGWLACNGAPVSRSTYADLFAVIGTAWGVGDGSSTFTLPSLGGAVLRCIGNGTVSGRTKVGVSYVGDFQEDSFQGHYHRYNYHRGVMTNGSDTDVDAIAATISPHTDTRVGQAITDGSNGTPRTGSETQVYSAGVQYMIKT